MKPDKTEQTLDARQKTHGEFRDNSEISRLLRRILIAEVRKNHADDIPAYLEEGIIMTCHKLARMACGNPRFEDHWRDISGYSKLVADRLLEDDEDKLKSNL